MCLLFEVHALYEIALAACNKAVQENGAQEIRPARNVFRLGHERVLFHRDRFKQTIHPKGSTVAAGSPLLSGRPYSSTRLIPLLFFPKSESRFHSGKRFSNSQVFSSETRQSSPAINDRTAPAPAMR